RQRARSGRRADSITVDLSGSAEQRVWRDARIESGLLRAADCRRGLDRDVLRRALAAAARAVHGIAVSDFRAGHDSLRAARAALAVPRDIPRIAGFFDRAV